MWISEIPLTHTAQAIVIPEQPSQRERQRKKLNHGRTMNAKRPLLVSPRHTILRFIHFLSLLVMQSGAAQRIKLPVSLMCTFKCKSNLWPSQTCVAVGYKTAHTLDSEIRSQKPVLNCWNRPVWLLNVAAFICIIINDNCICGLFVANIKLNWAFEWWMKVFLCGTGVTK